MTQRQQLAFLGCAQLDVLLGARTIADVGEHHAAVEAQLDRAIQLARGHGGHGGVRPGKELAAEAGAEKTRHHAHVFDRHAQHLRHHDAMVHDALRGFVERDAIAIPHDDRGVQLDGIVRLDGRDVGCVDFDGRGGKGRIGIAALGDRFALAVVIVEAGAHGWRFRGSYSTFTAAAAAVACSSVSAMTTATYWPQWRITSSSKGERTSLLVALSSPGTVR